jgi:hypothetical protein
MARECAFLFSRCRPPVYLTRRGGAHGTENGEPRTGLTSLVAQPRNHAPDVCSPVLLPVPARARRLEAVSSGPSAARLCALPAHDARSGTWQRAACARRQGRIPGARGPTASDNRCASAVRTCAPQRPRAERPRPRGIRHRSGRPPRTNRGVLWPRPTGRAGRARAPEIGALHPAPHGEYSVVRAGEVRARSGPRRRCTGGILFSRDHDLAGTRPGLHARGRSAGRPGLEERPGEHRRRGRAAGPLRNLCSRAAGSRAPHDRLRWAGRGPVHRRALERSPAAETRVREGVLAMAQLPDDPGQSGTEAAYPRTTDRATCRGCPYWAFCEPELRS